MQGLATIDQSPQRYEVLTGSPQRRHYSDAFKGRLVALSFERGACAADIGRRHGVHPQQMYTWRRQAREGVLALPAAEGAEFAPLVIAEDEPPVEAEAPAVLLSIEVGGVTVRLPGDSSAERIAEIAAALRGCL